MTIEFKKTEEISIAADQYLEEKAYWLDQLSGRLVRSSFPGDSIKSPTHEYKLARSEFKITGETFSRLLQFSNGSDFRLFMILLACLNILLHKYTSHDDIIVGTSIEKQEIEGDFVNTVLALRNRVRDDMTFKDLLVQVRQCVIEANEHPNYPLEVLLYDLDTEARGDKFPLLGVSILLENVHDKNYIRHLKNEMILTFRRTDDCLQGSIEYDPFLYQESTVERIISHFTRLAEVFLFNIETPIGQFEILSEAEIRELLKDLNDTAVPYPANRTLHHLFETQMEKTPDRVAVVFRDEHISYGELNTRANRLAAVLRSKRAGVNEMVGLMTDITIEAIVGMLAILKSGSAYLPIDPEFPPDRIKFMVADSRLRIILTESSCQDKISFAGELIALAEPELYTGSGSGIESKNDSTDLVYSIYTSGSTGKPKAVLVQHRHIVNQILGLEARYPFDSALHHLLMAPFTFDPSVQQVFLPLTSGGKLFLVPKAVKIDSDKLLNFIRVRQIDVLNAVPSLVNGLVNQVQDERSLKFKYVILAGEVFAPQLYRELRKRFAADKIINIYGPTEATINTTLYECRDEEIGTNIPIGKPLYNYAVYVVGPTLNLLPRGVPGELAIAGEGLARGYLNMPELTGDKYVVNPLMPGQRMYLTGDLVRWNNSGNLEFLGRIDQQVKIRGARVELAEVEKHLVKHGGIREAVVLAGEAQDGNPVITAYVVPMAKLTVSDLRQYLLGFVPDYMVPAHFVPLDDIPLTPNGKVDRKALWQHHDGLDTGRAYEAPGNQIEEALVQVWQNVLGIDKIGINEDYFDLGGDSIKAIQISARLQKYRLKMEIQDLFQYQNIKELSSHVKPLANIASQEAVAGPVKLTPIQRWFFERNFTDMHHSNHSFMLYRPSGFVEEAVLTAFQKIVNHHDALRLVFRQESGEVIQENRGLSSDFVDLQVFELKDVETIESAIEEKCNQIQKSIDLATGPILKLGLFRTGRGDYLLIVIHHLVVDGISWAVILEDFAALYQQIEEGQEMQLPLKTHAYREWAEKLYKYAGSEKLLAELPYWQRVGQMVPTSFSDGHGDRVFRLKDRESLCFELSREYTERLLKEVNRAYNTEINDILLAALGLAVKDWLGQERVLVDLEMHGREEIIEDIDISRTVGWFTAIFPVIIDVEGAGGLSQVIKKIKEMLRRVPTKGVGYGILKYLAAADKKRDVNLDSRAAIGFNYLGHFGKDIESEVFRIVDMNTGHDISPDSERVYPLDVTGIISNNTLQITVGYNRFEYKPDKMAALAQAYQENLQRIIDHCSQKEEAELTASDMTSEDFDEQEVSSIFEELEEAFSG